MRRISPGQFGFIKWGLFVLLALPAIVAAVRVLSGRVAEPADYLTHISGEFALRLLLATLLITPLAKFTAWNWLIKLRRMLGLYAFAYALLHFLVYLLLDVQLHFPTVLEDFSERRYITVGAVALLLLLPLAATSSNWAIKKMGARRWSRLHKAVYGIVPLAVIHFWWQIKNDAIAEPLGYALLAALLLALRHPRLAAVIQRR